MNKLENAKKLLELAEAVYNAEKEFNDALEASKYFGSLKLAGCIYLISRVNSTSRALAEVIAEEENLLKALKTKIKNEDNNSNTSKTIT